MKKIILSLLFVFITTALFAVTNTNSTASSSTDSPSVVESAKTTVTTNINGVIVDMLKGVKEASGEIYQASKSAISKSVDFAMEQAPLVVREFLMWRLAKSIVWSTIWAIPAFTLFYCARKCRKLAESDKVLEVASDGRLVKCDYTGFKWAYRSIGIILLMVNLAYNGMEIAEIVVAPRVYLIEYVASQIKENAPRR